MADRQQHDTHTTCRSDCVTEIHMDNSILIASDYFEKDTTTATADKMVRVLGAGAAVIQKSAV